MTDQEPPEAEPSETPAPEGPDPAEVKRAMKAFRKRLKLTRLDDESKLGHRAMSSGRQSSIVAIMPPYGYRQEIWDELVRQGRLKDAGRGFYELVE